MADTVVEDANRDKIPNEAWENLQRKPDNPSYGNPTGARKDSGRKEVELPVNGMNRRAFRQFQSSSREDNPLPKG